MYNYNINNDSDHKILKDSRNVSNNCSYKYRKMKDINTSFCEYENNSSSIKKTCEFRNIFASTVFNKNASTNATTTNNSNDSNNKDTNCISNISILCIFFITILAIIVDIVVIV